MATRTLTNKSLLDVVGLWNKNIPDTKLYYIYSLNSYNVELNPVPKMMDLVGFDFPQETGLNTGADFLLGSFFKLTLS
jgi:hypothetical protein